MIRVLQLPDTLEKRNGRMSVIMNVYRKLDLQKIKFDFLCTAGKSETYENEIKALGGEVYYLPQDQLSLKNVSREIYKVLAKHNYDYVHYHAISKWGIALNIAKKKGIKTIVHSHATTLSDSYVKAIRNGIFSLNVLTSDKKVAVSPEAGQKLFMGRDFTYIPNMISYNDFAFSAQKRSQIRAKLGVADDEILIGNVGRISKQKNQEFSLRTFVQLKSLESGQKYKLIFIGDDTSQGQDRLNKLKSIVSNKGLSSDVIFTGLVSNVNDYYSALDLIWMPSFFEGQPTVGIEAQANGLYLILSKKISLSTDITGNVSFLGITTSDISRWEEETLSKSRYRDAYAIEKIEKSPFNEQRVLNMWLNLYGV